jgi:hypothetical protein
MIFMMLLAVLLSIGTTNLLASPDNVFDSRPDVPGNGGESGFRIVPSADFIPNPPIKGKGEGQIFE